MKYTEKIVFLVAILLSWISWEEGLRFAHSGIFTGIFIAVLICFLLLWIILAVSSKSNRNDAICRIASLYWGIAVIMNALAIVFHYLPALGDETILLFTPTLQLSEFFFAGFHSHAAVSGTICSLFISGLMFAVFWHYSKQ